MREPQAIDILLRRVARQVRRRRAEHHALRGAFWGAAAAAALLVFKSLLGLVAVVAG
ncbi:MAG: hypothetical protein AAB387_11005 [candidate division NC10 bacterium]